MLANIHPETGIRYGVVSMNSLHSWVWDEFQSNGVDLTAKAALEEWREENPDADEDDEQEFWDTYYPEESCYSLETDGMRLELSYLGGAPIVFVLESPHVAECRECSPCCPHAGDLDSKQAGGFDAYDVPQDWYGND